MRKFSRLAIIFLMLAVLPLLLALGVNPGIFTHDHANVNQGGALLKPIQLTSGPPLVGNIAGCNSTDQILCAKQNNGQIAFYIERGTDVSPSGWFAQWNNAANSQVLFGVDFAGIVQTPSIGTVALRTATGSATYTTQGSGSGCVASYGTLVLSDYAFFPNASSNSGCASTDVGFYMIGTLYSDTVGRLVINAPHVSGTGGPSTTTVQWRYMTSTDNPRAWVVADQTGAIQSVWVADDPAPGDVPAIETPCTSCTTYKFGAHDFSYLAALETQYQNLAEQWIAGKQYSLTNLDYRVIQAAASNLQTVISPSRTQLRVIPDDLGAPANWIRQNAVVNPVTGHLCPQSSPSC